MSVDSGITLTMTSESIETGKLLAAALALEWSQSLVQQHVTLAVVLTGKADHGLRASFVPTFVRPLIVV